MKTQNIPKKHINKNENSCQRQGLVDGASQVSLLAHGKEEAETETVQLIQCKQEKGKADELRYRAWGRTEKPEAQWGETRSRAQNHRRWTT